MRFNLSPKGERAIKKNLEKPLAPYWVCDIEANNWVEFLTIGLTDGQGFWHFDNLDYKSPRRRKEGANKALTEFFAFLFDRSNSKHTVFAHFGGKYDFLFLLHHLFLESNAGFEIESIIPRGSGILCFDVIDGYGTKITFRDSSALLPFSLRSLCENFHVDHPKLDMEYENMTLTPMLIEYLKHDCMGLWEVIDKYRNWDLVRQAGSAYTIAGQSLKVLQTMMPLTVYSLSERVDSFVRQAYFGGRTEIFKPLYTGGHLSCFDVNSLYPTAMLNEFPVKFDGFSFDYRPDSMAFWDAEVEVPDDMYVPPLGVVWDMYQPTDDPDEEQHYHKHKKFIFPTGRFRGRWSTIELEYAKSLGVKVIRTGMGARFMNGGHLFRNFVEELYRIRETTPRDSVDNVLAKLMLNSTYGRFGLRTDRVNLVVDEGQLGVRFFSEIGTGDRKVRLMENPVELKTFTNVAVAAWVTSQARIHMHKLYSKIESELYYTDTDSLFTTASFEDVRGLGGLKREYGCENACFLLPKTYITDGVDGLKTQDGDPILKKITMKGFDRKKIKGFTLEDFTTALEGDLRRLRASAPEKVATFKTALKKNQILALLPESPRAIRSMYDKRVIYKTQTQQYDTRPHKIIDNQPIILEKSNCLF